MNVPLTRHSFYFSVHSLSSNDLQQPVKYNLVKNFENVFKNIIIRPYK